MIIIGTDEEISELQSRCDARCIKGEWCVFGFQKHACPIDSSDGCLAFDNIITGEGVHYSILKQI